MKGTNLKLLSSGGPAQNATGQSVQACLLWAIRRSDLSLDPALRVSRGAAAHSSRTPAPPQAWRTVSSLLVGMAETSVSAHFSIPQGEGERALWLSRYVAFLTASGVEPEKALPAPER